MIQLVSALRLTFDISVLRDAVVVHGLGGGVMAILAAVIMPVFSLGVGGSMPDEEAEAGRCRFIEAA